MVRILIPPETPCVIPDFDPDADVLIVALPGDRGDTLDHSLAFRPDRTRGALDVVLTHAASGARFLIRLPGLTHLDPSAIAVMSLADAERLALPGAPSGAARPEPAPQREDTATLTGEGLYPREVRHGGKGPRKMRFTHAHNWYRDGPPAERFFDLSHPESELRVTLREGTGGPIYAIRLTERRIGGHDRRASRGDDLGDDRGDNLGDNRGAAGRPVPPRAVEIHRSIILAQTAPGTPHLSTGLLAQWFATRLGTKDFRVIAWIWLGSAGYRTDPATGQRQPFGAINRNPGLAIVGPLAGSIAITR